jgi:transporter family-2 protein
MVGTAKKQRVEMLGWSILSAVGGISFVFQQAVNSQLRMEIGSAWRAGFLSYLGGTLVMLLMVVALRDPLPTAAIGTTPWVSLSGGSFGAIYIAISILMLPKLGATTVLALIVLGQMVDHLLSIISACLAWLSIR